MNRTKVGDHKAGGKNNLLQCSLKIIYKDSGAPGNSVKGECSFPSLSLPQLPASKRLLSAAHPLLSSQSIYNHQRAEN